MSKFEIGNAESKMAGTLQRERPTGPVEGRLAEDPITIVRRLERDAWSPLLTDEQASTVVNRCFLPAIDMQYTASQGMMLDVQQPPQRKFELCDFNHGAF